MKQLMSGRQMHQEDFEKVSDSTHVLHFTENWGNGGVESYVLNLVRHSKEINYSIASAWSNYSGYDNELCFHGINRIVLSDTMPSKPSLRFIDSVKSFRNFLIKNHEYTVCHIHGLNGAATLYALIAKRMGIPKVILHSHNSDFGNGSRMLKKAVHFSFLKLFGSFVDCRFACSQEAGLYLFSKKHFSVVNNGIDIDRFSYSHDLRNAVRKELGISDATIVVGTVGRMHPQKNPMFILSIIKALESISADFKFIWIGSGELENAIKDKAKRLSLDKHIYFLGGSVDNVSSYLSAMDCFVLPSLYEGLSIAAIEAQASGLPCLFSENINKSTCIDANKVDYLPITDSDTIEWAKKIASYSFSYDRLAAIDYVKRKGFDASDCFSEVINEYLKL